MLRDDPAYAEKAARVSALAQDISEYLATLKLGAPAQPQRPQGCLPGRLLDPARPENHKTAQGRCWRRPGSRCARSARRTCAAVRPEPTTSCSPTSPAALRARKVANIERTRRGRDCDRQHRLHDAHRARDRDSSGAHGRAHRLGSRWTGARCAARHDGVNKSRRIARPCVQCTDDRGRRGFSTLSTSPQYGPALNP